jgi:heme/copper-type cytochrome/quinol oxidase subunit 2
MSTDKLLELLFTALPTIIVAVLAYFFFQNYFESENRRRRYILHKEAQKSTLPLRLQAYERLSLFLERIDPTRLLVRLTPAGNDKTEYENYVIAQIELEFEHNLTQQVYVSAECWNVIVTAKNATIQTIRKTNMSPRIDSANKLREELLTDLFEKQSPSSIALAHLKLEVSELWNE